jgi:hypothetical protein
MNRDYQNRSRGNTRTNNYRSSGAGARPSGGARRGGRR